MRRIAALLATLTLCWAACARAHDVTGSAVYLDMGSSAIGIELHVPVSQLLLARELPAQPAWSAERDTELPAYLRQHVRARSADGTALSLQLDALVSAPGAREPEVVARGRMLPARPTDLRHIQLDLDLILHRVVTHNVYVFVRRDLWAGRLDAAPELAGLMHWQKKSLAVDRPDGSIWRGLVASMRLGARHIAEGTDHLLFLLMLLLPAPLLAVAGRWRERAGLRQSLWAVAKLVSAFTCGHSLTLMLAAVRGVELPVRPVETLIALSIVAAAVHALWPLWRASETWIALGFGLVHGLGFAGALRGFGFDTGSLLVALGGFNLGIELMQLTLVLCVVPCLLLLSRRPIYPVLRVTGAAAGLCAGLIWIGERALT